jgi:predicted alpha/beta-hydrolase family hydrolase
VTVALDASGGRDLIVLAHGAGGSMNDRGLLAVRAALRERGFDVMRFNFPYSEKKGRRPDPMPKLEACIAAVVAFARERVAPKRLIFGGRSMGGRAASMLAAEGFDADALLLLAYPLHPAGKPQQLRDAHLLRITMPVLCVNGTRDPLCRRDLMEGVVSKLGRNWTMHWLEGADHSFHVTKASGRTDADVQDEIGTTVDSWRVALR